MSTPAEAPVQDLSGSVDEPVAHRKRGRATSKSPVRRHARSASPVRSERRRTSYDRGYAERDSSPDMQSGSVFVGKLAPETTEEEIMKLMVPYGAVKQVKLLTHPDGMPKGFGFVHFGDGDGRAAKEAIKGAHGKLLHGRYIVVNHAHVQLKAGQPDPRGGGFGWGNGFGRGEGGFNRNTGYIGGPGGRGRGFIGGRGGFFARGGRCGPTGGRFNPQGFNGGPNQPFHVNPHHAGFKDSSYAARQGAAEKGSKGTRSLSQDRFSPERYSPLAPQTRSRSPVPKRQRTASRSPVSGRRHSASLSPAPQVAGTEATPADKAGDGEALRGAEAGCVTTVHPSGEQGPPKGTHQASTFSYSEGSSGSASSGSSSDSEDSQSPLRHRHGDVSTALVPAKPQGDHCRPTAACTVTLLPNANPRPSQELNMQGVLKAESENLRRELASSKLREAELTTQLAKVETELAAVNAAQQGSQEQLVSAADRLKRSEEAGKQYRKWLSAMGEYARALLRARSGVQDAEGAVTTAQAAVSAAQGAVAVAATEAKGREEDLGLFLAEADSFMASRGSRASKRKERDNTTDQQQAKEGSNLLEESAVNTPPGNA